MVSAFDNILTILGEENQTIPLIFDSPHSGDLYPKDFKHNTTFEKLRQAEDSYVDELYNDCLLYTSPSPRDIRRSRMPSSA